MTEIMTETEEKVGLSLFKQNQESVQGNTCFVTALKNGLIPLFFGYGSEKRSIKTVTSDTYGYDK